MTEQEILKLYLQQSKQVRAEYFRTRVAFSTRIPMDYDQHPELLTLDLAWAVMAALCAADVAGIDLDVNAAVEAGKALFKKQYSDDPGGSSV